MNIVERIEGFFLGRDRFYKNSRYQQIEQIGNRSPIPLDISNLELVYLENALLRTVIDNNASMISKLKWEMVNKDGEVIGGEHKELDLLMSPNPYQSSQDFLFNLAIQEDVSGNAFVNMVRGLKNALPSAMHIVPSQGMEIKLTGKLFKQTKLDDIIERYKYTRGDLTQKFEVEEIMRFKQPDISPIIAESKLKGLRLEISNLKGAWESSNVLLNERGAIGILSYDSGNNSNNRAPIPMTPTDRKRAEERLTKHYGTKDGQRRTAISPIPVKYQPMVMPTKDLLLSEERRDAFESIVSAFGQHIGMYINGTYENQKETQKSVYLNSIIPRANRWAGVLNKEFGLDGGGKILRPTFDLDILQESALKKNQAESVKVQSLLSLLEQGIITDADIKAILQL
jgi:HK97 family phage portal protein